MVPFDYVYKTLQKLYNVLFLVDWKTQHRLCFVCHKALKNKKNVIKKKKKNVKSIDSNKKLK